MQNFNFDSIVLTGSLELYRCLDNGAPIRPVEPEDEGYPEDPEVLYFWKYRSSIISQVSVTNNNTKPIKITLSLLKNDTDSINVTNDITVPAGDTFVPIGEINKLFLEYNDSIHILIKNAVDESLVITSLSIMNIYDYGHIPPIWTRLPFFGNVGAFGNGENLDFYIDKIEFLSDSISTHYADITRYYNGKGCASNSIECVWTGGYSNYNYIESMAFSTFVFNANWGYLYDGTGYTTSVSDAITIITAGGYNRQNVVQANYFASGGTGVYWGSLYQGGIQYLASCNDFIRSLWMGGYYGNTLVSSNEFSSSGSSTFWGNLWNGHTLYLGCACSNDVMGLSHGNGSLIDHKEVMKHLFQSASDSTYFGDLAVVYAMYENGAVGNSQKALFGGDERYSDELYEVYYDAEFSCSFWGNCTSFDGGYPAGASGL